MDDLFDVRGDGSVVVCLDGDALEVGIRARPRRSSRGKRVAVAGAAAEDVRNALTRGGVQQRAR